MFQFLIQRTFVRVGLALGSFTLVTILYISPSYTTHYDAISNLQLSPASEKHELSLVRVCCLILTSPKYFLTRTTAVNETWAPRCDRYFFITESAEDKMTPEQRNFTQQVPIAPIKNITPGYDHLTLKSNLAFIFAYENYFKDFDWFVKADDDTYVIVDHLKLFLSDKNASEPVTYGYTYNIHVPKGYHSGGASYVLSREALRRFYEAQNDPASGCKKDGGSEDIEIAACLRGKGVYPGKSLDKQNRELFHPLPFAAHFRGSFPDWLINRAENPLRTKYDCCSDQTISFHYVNPDDQYFMHFLLYKAQPTGARGRIPVRKLNSSTVLVN